MVTDTDRQALRDLSKAYAQGSLPAQEYRQRRSVLLDGLSSTERGRVRATASDDSRSWVWLAVVLIVSAIAAVGAIVLV